MAPSPAYEATLSSPAPSEIHWRAKYGESAYPDAFLVALFVRSVENRGTWQVADASKVCGVHAYRQPRELALYPVTVGDGYWHPSDITDEERSLAVELGCTHLVAVVRVAGRNAISGIELLPVTGDPALRLELPRERPVLDPRRWGWLLAAPFLDAATIVAAPPTLLFLVIADATDLQW